MKGIEIMGEIEKGDIVSVSFHNVQMTLIKHALVLHVPCATGDSWQFKDTGSKDIFYISEGCTVMKSI